MGSKYVGPIIFFMGLVECVLGEEGLTLRAAFASSAVVVNGQRDEACWQVAVPYRQDPLMAWALWDATALYLSFESKENKLESLKANAGAGEEKKIFDDDTVEWFLADRATDKTYRWLVNVKGVTADGVGEDFSWESNIKARVIQERLRRTWKGELTVPWAEMNIPNPTHSALWLWVRRRGPHALIDAPPVWVRLIFEGFQERGAETRSSSASSIDEIEMLQRIRTSLSSLDVALERFKLDFMYNPPDSVEWVVILKSLAATGEKSGDFYYRELDQVLKALPVPRNFSDPKTRQVFAGPYLKWGQDGPGPLVQNMSYRVHEKGYEMIYLGSDGVLGTDDDVRSEGSMSLPHEDPKWFGVRVGQAAEGVVVRWVAKKSHAEAAGLRVGDIFTTLEGRRIGSPKQFADQIAGFHRGSRIKMVILRHGKPADLTVLLGQ